MSSGNRSSVKKATKELDPNTIWAVQDCPKQVSSLRDKVAEVNTKMLPFSNFCHWLLSAVLLMEKLQFPFHWFFLLNFQSFLSIEHWYELLSLEKSEPQREQLQYLWLRTGLVKSHMVLQQEPRGYFDSSGYQLRSGSLKSCSLTI